MARRAGRASGGAAAAGAERMGPLPQLPTAVPPPPRVPLAYPALYTTTLHAHAAQSLCSSRSPPFSLHCLHSLCPSRCHQLFFTCLHGFCVCPPAGTMRRRAPTHVNKKAMLHPQQPPAIASPSPCVPPPPAMKCVSRCVCLVVQSVLHGQSVSRPAAAGQCLPACRPGRRSVAASCKVSISAAGCLYACLPACLPACMHASLLEQRIHAAAAREGGDLVGGGQLLHGLHMQAPI